MQICCFYGHLRINSQEVNVQDRSEITRISSSLSSFPYHHRCRFSTSRRRHINSYFCHLIKYIYLHQSAMGEGRGGEENRKENAHLSHSPTDITLWKLIFPETRILTVLFRYHSSDVVGWKALNFGAKIKYYRSCGGWFIIIDLDSNE